MIFTGILPPTGGESDIFSTNKLILPRHLYTGTLTHEVLAHVGITFNGWVLINLMNFIQFSFRVWFRPTLLSVLRQLCGDFELYKYN